jgi:hypothetical protein
MQVNAMPGTRTPNIASDIQSRLSVRSLVRPAHADPRRSTLVVVEAGAAVTGLLIESACGREGLTVRQAADEPPADLLVRIFARAALLERSGKPLARVLFAVAACGDAQATAARRTIARALLTRLSASGSGELLFWAALAEPESRHELLALIEGLLIAPGTSGASVRVRFVKCPQATRRTPQRTRAGGLRPGSDPLPPPTARLGK